MIHYLIKHGYPGRLLPINPNRATIRGLPAYPGIGTVPEPVDVAILAVPVAHLLRQVEDCAAAGVGACIIITGKLADAGAEGAALQDRVLEVARAAGMRLVGPNCLGIFNMTDAAMLSSSLVLEAERVKPGGIGMVSQSGALMGTLVSVGLHHGAGFSRCISVGNQADLELCDFLDFLIDDPATRVIALYIEGLKDPARFAPLLRRARAAGKPVLCVKAGRSAAGAQAARSHTASLAGSFAAFEAVCREAGAVLCDDPAVMVQAADALDRLPRLPRAGMGLAVIASSGGSTVTTADMLPAHGLRLGEMAEATRAELRRWMPESHVHLPLDTGSFDDGTSEDGLSACMRSFMADPDIGAVVVPMTTQPAMAARAALFPELCRQGGRPVLFVMTAAEVGDAARQALRAADFLPRPGCRFPGRAAGTGGGVRGPRQGGAAAAGTSAWRRAGTGAARRRAD
ncbi:CoA-binding protein [Siccirubricoccus deserti]